MTMRTSHTIVACAVLGALATVPAHAATTEHFNMRGTAVDFFTVTSVTAGPNCTVDTLISFSAATSVGHGATPGTSSGWGGFVQQFDNCTGTQAIGSFDAPLAAGNLSTGAHTATLNASVVITLTVFNPEFEVVGSVDKTLTASGLRFDAIQAESFVGKIHNRFRFPNFSSTSSGHSNESPASLSGVLTFDGASLLTDPGSIFASFQTSTQIAVTVIK
jgi:hypothetical protein